MRTGTSLLLSILDLPYTLTTLRTALLGPLPPQLVLPPAVALVTLLPSLPNLVWDHYLRHSFMGACVQSAQAELNSALPGFMQRVALLQRSQHGHQ